MLTQALERREIIQATLMRATIHMVSAADYWPMDVGMRRIRAEWFEKVAAREIEKFDIGAVADAVRDVLADGPLRMKRADRAARGARLSADRRAVGRDVGRPREGSAVRNMGAPPRRSLRTRRRVAAEARRSRRSEGMELLIRRYLGAFGPAPLKDVASWMGMKVGQMRDVADRLELRPFRDESGGSCSTCRARRCRIPTTPAPPRFLAVWDAALLVHARRTLILPEELRPLIFNTKTPHSHNTFLLDGQVAGTWRHEGGEISLTPLRPLTAAERASLDDGGASAGDLPRGLTTR